MYTRNYEKPPYSFFLFGPRSTGKTTWLREQFPDALWFNLLLDRDLLPLLQDVARFSQAVLSRPAGWVVVDEVQKCPALLNEIHNLISLHGDRYKFALSGSSARKLRRQGVNLLAGRVIERKFSPLTYAELGSDFNLETILQFGTLPTVWNKLSLAEEILEAYVGTYIREEIKQEALVQDLGAFSRFLPIAALANGSNVSVANIAREAGVARKTVEGYFQILEDTLIAHKLPSWQPKARTRETIKPKLYLFDCGVVRALGDTIKFPLRDEERGLLLETYLFGEIRNLISRRVLKANVYFWQTTAGAEIDFILDFGSRKIGIEVKGSKIWRRVYAKALKQLVHENILSEGFGVYTGTTTYQDGPISVLPVPQFLEWLQKLDHETVSS